MALNDILKAITEDADKRIADAKATHDTRIRLMRDEGQRTELQKRQSISELRDQKMRQLKERAQSHARMLRGKKILSKKQEYATKVYADVMNALSAAPKKDIESFLEKALSMVKGPGVIHPAAAHADFIKKHLPSGCTLGDAIATAGGFRFVSGKHEHDFTFEFLVNNVLRAKTEARVASAIFPA
jgi:vacuolar-type H+-ATPase subunit E/Vma4